MFFSVPVRSSAWAWLTPKAAASATPKICNCFITCLPTWMIGRNACTNRAGIECDFWRPFAPEAGLLIAVGPPPANGSQRPKTEQPDRGQIIAGREAADDSERAKPGRDRRPRAAE